MALLNAIAAKVREDVAQTLPLAQNAARSPRIVARSRTKGRRGMHRAEHSATGYAAPSRGPDLSPSEATKHSQAYGRRLPQPLAQDAATSIKNLRPPPGMMPHMLAAFLALAVSCAPQDPPRNLEAMLTNGSKLMQAVAKDATEHRLQILLAEPVQQPDGSVTLRRSRLGDPRRYFYPASSVKLCAIVAALEELNARNKRDHTTFGLDTPIAIEARFPGDKGIDKDATNLADGTLTLGHCIRRICLVSDNECFNHLYELCGQQRLNEVLWEAGYRSVRIRHRLSEANPTPDQAKARPVVLGHGDQAVRIAHADSNLNLTNDLWTDLSLGKAVMRAGKRIDEPMSCTTKNAVLLQDLQDMLVEVVHPEIDTGTKGFPGLTTEQRDFLKLAMSQLPRHSSNPVYDEKKYPDDYVKFFLPGVTKVIPLEHVRIYSKIGCAYGCTIENSWIEDVRTGRGFALAAVIYTNPDGVMNDDAYGYEQIAYPFLADLGEAIARAVFAGK